LSTKEIAYRISVTVSTVKTHRKNLFGKLGVTRRSQAIAYAREKMII
jgi:LuxR family maltose regulon positive regulatory protein